MVKKRRYAPQFPPVPAMTAAQIARQVGVVFRDGKPETKQAVLDTLGPYGPSEVFSGKVGLGPASLFQLAQPAPASVLDEVRRTEGVAFAGPNVVLGRLQGPSDTLYGEQWALDRISAEAAWRCAGAPAGGVVVAIVDSGITANDPAHDPLSDLPAGLHPASSADPDDDGHGTLLAGTIGALTDNNRGVAAASWPAANLVLMPVRFFGVRTPLTSMAAAIAITHAVDSGADIINASFDVALDVPELREAVRWARDRGVLFVAGAGNDGTDNDRLPTYPASYLFENVISVMATDRYDDKPGFSNYGENTVHLAAPGVDVLSTHPWLAPSVAPGPHVTPGFRSYSGTSAACALVTGAAALLKAIDPGWTPAEIRDHLMASADRLDVPPIYRRWLLGGRLNLGRAVCGPIAVTRPHAAQVWQHGTQEDVKWERQYVTAACETLKIVLCVSPDNGLTFPPVQTLAANVPNDADPSWALVVPAGHNTDFARLRLESEQRTLRAESETFSIKP